MFMKFYTEPIKKSPRISLLVDTLFKKMPQIEADRAILLTESYRATEGEPIITRRAKAFKHILEHIPITIREHELIVGSATRQPRSCQVFPEYSFEWLQAEFDTVATRTADPFYISDDTKAKLSEVYKYWKGKTTSELATSYMSDEAKTAIEHGMFTPGNYFYNGIGHVTVDYPKVLAIGYEGIISQAKNELSTMSCADADYARRKHFLDAVIMSCEAAIMYAERYSELAATMAKTTADIGRRRELEKIAVTCRRVPKHGAQSFYEACQSFWFVQMLLQTESSGHSISPGRFDQYMYPYYKKDIDSETITREQAQELIDCVWVKLNDLNKVRDAASAEGFAGYSLFQNLIVGGQDKYGRDATNDLSFMAITATEHVFLPQPSFSVRVWNGSPHEFLIRAAELTRTGIGFPAYYNDEVIIPSLQSRGLTLEDARDYNIIGCVEPQKAAKTDGWHDAAFFNMCRPLELVFSSGEDKGVQLGPKTQIIDSMTSYEEFENAYRKQMTYFIELMVNADNAIDLAHAERCPLPFQSCMVDDCISKGKSLQEGGAIYNFTGPQGFGIANVADAMFAVKKLVFDDKKYTLDFWKAALESNYGKDMDHSMASKLTQKIVASLVASGNSISEDDIKTVYLTVKNNPASDADKKKYAQLLDDIHSLKKFGNDDDEIDLFAREMAYTYTKPLERYKNPRGGIFQAGLYPVSANVPLGAQTGATPDGRLAFTPVADGVSPAAGRDQKGPTAAANSVSRLDHYIASNGTLFNMKFHPSALEGRSGLESFVALVRGYFDQKGSHMQFNVVSRETLRDAQKNPEKYRSLVVRVAGYSALFTTLSKGLQEDIINRTEQQGF
ncbi:MAG: glycyl radical protein [Ruminococcaceae bacterium]|nr:glycyl radical protein [Oscillospiraceae bacterium]